jgi:uncharacterized membrane protein YphA (DoxX/SURF4 family)
VIYLVGVIEISIAIALIVGGFGNETVTRVAAAVIVILTSMGVVMHWPNGFSMMNKGYETFLLIMAGAVYFLISGNLV